MRHLPPQRDNVSHRWVLYLLLFWYAAFLWHPQVWDGFGFWRIRWVGAFSGFAAGTCLVVFLVRDCIRVLRDDQHATRRREGRCVHCGYDQRATPERCPECGASSERLPG